MRARRVLVMAVLLAGLGEALAAAAPASSVRVTARAFPEKITVGGELRLVLTVERPRDWAIDPPGPKTLRLEPFELKRVERPAVPLSGQNRVQETYVFVLTAFQTGDLEVPAVVLTYEDNSGNRAATSSDPVPVKVVSVLKEPAAGKKQPDLKPIKGPVSAGFPAREILLGVLAAVLAAALVTRRVLAARRSVKPDPESLLPAHERATRELGRLRQAAFMASGKSKEHYTGLADILRRYIQRRFGLPAADLTSAELLHALRGQARLDTPVLRLAQDVLETADLVKFAKYAPPSDVTGRVESALEEAVRLSTPPPEPAGTRK